MPKLYQRWWSFQSCQQVSQIFDCFHYAQMLTIFVFSYPWFAIWICTHQHCISHVWPDNSCCKCCSWIHFCVGLTSSSCSLMLKTTQASAKIRHSSVHSLIYSFRNVSLIFICNKHPFFIMDWKLNRLHLKYDAISWSWCTMEYPNMKWWNGWPTSAILRWSVYRCFHLCRCTNYRPCETLNGT